MGNFKIDDLKNTLGLGARTNKYQIILNGVGGGPSGEQVNTLAKSASIPGRSFAEVEIWNQGRLTTVAGDADFGGTWSVTFLDDEYHSLRMQFIAWMEYIDSVANHDRAASSHDDYMSTAQMIQLSTVDNSPTITYEFADIWPKTISDTAMSDDSPGMVEFTVEFNYTSWSIV
jgi:hypothetical protein